MVFNLKQAKTCDYDLAQLIKDRAKVLRKKGLSEFEIAIFLTFILLPFFSLEDK